MFPLLLARLFGFAWSRIAPAAAVAARAGGSAAGRRVGLAITGGAVAADLLNIDELRTEAVRIAPTSDPEALEEAARQILRMTGADGSDVMWPGNGGIPKYYHMNLQNGQQWFTANYTSANTVRAAARRGNARGFRAGQRSIATISQAQRG